MFQIPFACLLMTNIKKIKNFLTPFTLIFAFTYNLFFLLTCSQKGKHGDI